jgi:hypothetical protein
MVIIDADVKIEQIHLQMGKTQYHTETRKIFFTLILYCI